jgi:hypothetical protein
MARYLVQVPLDSLSEDRKAGVANSRHGRQSRMKTITIRHF